MFNIVEFIFRIVISGLAGYALGSLFGAFGIPLAAIVGIYMALLPF